MTSKEELDELCENLPGKNVKYTKNSNAAKKTLLELKRLNMKKYFYDEEEKKEYSNNIKSLLWILGDKGNWWENDS